MRMTTVRLRVLCCRGFENGESENGESENGESVRHAVCGSAVLMPAPQRPGRDSCGEG